MGRGLAEVLKHYRVLGISDEVMGPASVSVPEGKLGHDHYLWSPDILVSGRGLYVPISVLSANDRVADALAKPFEFVLHVLYLLGA